jgi:small GTP-binding protein
MSNPSPTILKLILLGDSSVGKSSILIRYTEGIFVDKTSQTVGSDFRTHDVTINGAIYRLQIWDTAGQERFRGIVEAYYRKAQGILLLFDQSFSNSFDSLPEWLTSINEHAAPNVPVVIVGNKADLKTVVTFDRINAFVESHGLHFVSTSAVQGMGIEEAFMDVAKLVVERQSQLTEVSHEVDLTKDGAGQNKCGC